MPPPGWYHDGAGMRWWDGSSWGPAAPPSGAQSDDRTFSMLCHGGIVVGGFILPLVFYLVSDEQTRPETRWHSRQALNFQLTFLAVYLLGFGVLFIGLAAGGIFGANGSDAGFGAGFGIGLGLFFLLVMGAVVANIVFSIIGAVKANAGVRWTYPIKIPFVRN